MTKAVYPGSFDPMTYGHLDIITRSANLFDEVVVAVLINSAKSPLFPVDEKVALLKEATKDLKNVKIDSFEGLLVDFVERNGVDVIVKGLRAVSDFESELQMAAMNRKLNSVETVFMMTATEYSFLSSSLVKEVSRLGGDVSPLVPDHVNQALKRKYSEE
ncbi:MAG: pantetheine-phosphate adenylyltransferase [Clostridia bacterium]|nr:pantetheine-phosphate adenylyltransferase [Clostridia bacterium]